MDLMQTRSLVAKVATVAAQGHRSSDEARAGWVTRARCRSINPDELFVRGAAQRKATLICRHCPVIAECLADALDNQMEFGVWGENLLQGRHQEFPSETRATSTEVPRGFTAKLTFKF